MYASRNMVLGFVIGLLITAILVKTGTIERHWYNLPLAIVVSLPYTFGGNVYSLWGGWSDRNICSLFGFFQHAEGSAISLTGVSFYQRAGAMALQLFGISIYQKSIDDAAVQIAGLTIFQVSDNDVAQWLGIAVLQKAKHDAIQGGIAVVIQIAGEESHQFGGFALLRKAEFKHRSPLSFELCDPIGIWQRKAA